MVAKRSSRLELNRLAYFAAVVDAGAFTRAAERLGVTKAVVSQQVARLEEELGVTLLLRTTRKLALTKAGRKLYTRCLTILRESAEALIELAEDAVEPSGSCGSPPLSITEWRWSCRSWRASPVRIRAAPSRCL